LYVASSTVLGIVKVDLKTLEVKGLATGAFISRILDGLYQEERRNHRDSRMYIFPEVIAHYKLNTAGDSIVNEKVLAVSEPLLFNSDYRCDCR
jgi:hypothetical protein